VIEAGSWLVVAILPEVWSVGKSAGTNGPKDGEGRFGIPEQPESLPRKTSNRTTVRIRTKTDTGRRGEYPQALERTVLKELGKLTP
jgi:hypothetical protein